MAEAALSTVVADLPDSRPIDRRAIHKATLRASAATTTSYVASDHVRCGQGDTLVLLFALTWVDSTSTEWYVEWSNEGTTFYRSTNIATSGATNTATLNNQTLASGASANWAASYTVLAPYARVQVKKTGGVGADALAVVADIVTL